MSSTKQNAMGGQARTELVLALLGGETTVAEAAEEHGVEPAELECWKALYLDGLRHAARAARPSWLRRLGRSARRRPIAATGGALAALAVLLVPVTALSETPAGCTDEASLDLCQFFAGEPAVAAEVNSNFTKLLGWLQSKVGGVDDPDNITTGDVVAEGSVSATTVAADVVDASGVAVGAEGLAVNGPLTVASENSPTFMFLIEMDTATGTNAGGWDTGVPTADWNCFIGGLAMLNGDIQESGVGNPLFAYTFVATNSDGVDTWRLAADFRSHNTSETHTIGVVCMSTGVSRRDSWFATH